MAKENCGRYAILALLSWGPCRATTSRKRSNKASATFGARAWADLPILKRLAAEGLAAMSVDKQVGKPDRYVYTLTEKGRKALQRWLRQPAEAEVGRIEILLKLFFGRQVAVADNRRQVRQFHALQRQLLQKFDAIEGRLKTGHTGHPDLSYWLMTLGYGRHACQARLRWCDEALTMLREVADHA